MERADGRARILKALLYKGCGLSRRSRTKVRYLDNAIGEEALDVWMCKSDGKDYTSEAESFHVFFVTVECHAICQ
jgi:hypothetical protein